MFRSASFSRARFRSRAHFLSRTMAVPAALVVLAGLALPASAADRWTAVREDSSITFAGTQAGAAFTGRFVTFDSDIVFDPQDLAASGVTVTIETGSATTGDAQKDANLPAPNWFDTNAFPEATFATETIAADGDGYIAKGTLEIRGITKPVQLPFTVTIDGDRAEMVGSTTVKRTDFGIGAGIPAEMIGDDVTVSVKVSATREK